MRSRLPWIGGGLAVAALLYRQLARRTPTVPVEEPRDDPRAEELRRKLAESRSLAGEREEFESAETPVDQAEPTDVGVERRRGQVHETGRAAAEHMRRSSPSG